jgi:hypothetical protein
MAPATVDPRPGSNGAAPARRRRQPAPSTIQTGDERRSRHEEQPRNRRDDPRIDRSDGDDDADEGETERTPGSSPLQAPPESQRQDRHDRRVDVHDQSGERGRDGFEPGEVGRRVAGVEDAKGDGHRDRPPVERADGAAAPGGRQDPGPRQCRPDREAPGHEGQPVDPGRVDRFRKERPRPEGEGRDHRQDDTEGERSGHRGRLAARAGDRVATAASLRTLEPWGAQRGTLYTSSS